MECVGYLFFVAVRGADHAILGCRHRENGFVPVANAALDRLKAANEKAVQISVVTAGLRRAQVLLCIVVLGHDPRAGQSKATRE